MRTKTCTTSFVPLSIQLLSSLSTFSAQTAANPSLIDERHLNVPVSVFFEGRVGIAVFYEAICARQTPRW